MAEVTRSLSILALSFANKHSPVMTRIAEQGDLPGTISVSFWARRGMLAKSDKLYNFQVAKKGLNEFLDFVIMFKFSTAFLYQRLFAPRDFPSLRDGTRQMGQIRLPSLLPGPIEFEERTNMYRDRPRVWRPEIPILDCSPLPF